MIKRCPKCKLEMVAEENFYKNKSHKDGYRSSCKACDKKYNETKKEWRKEYNHNNYLENCEQIKAAIKEYQKENREAVRSNKNRYHKERRAKDPIYKLIGNLRHRTNIDLKSKNLEKTKKFKDYLGCTPEEAKIYLEAQFTPDMNWDNYGKYFEIDHIIPLCSARTEEEVLKLCHYTNLRPLSKKAHYTKSVLDKATYPKD